jgi:hypothetical protein
MSIISAVPVKREFLAPTDFFGVVFQRTISLRFSDKFMLYFVGLPQQPAAVRLAFFDISVEVPCLYYP